jgi:hypothetical protein
MASAQEPRLPPTIAPFLKALGALSNVHNIDYKDHSAANRTSRQAAGGDALPARLGASAGKASSNGLVVLESSNPSVVVKGN